MRMKALVTATALALIAVPVMGQTVTCATCTHEVSVYMGEGGFIAAADSADKVTWVATCGGVTTSGELEANADGVVAMLFNEDNGLACSNETASLKIGPVVDGGWFWITDDLNSAVGSLVNMDVMDNDATDITSAGSGVTMMVGRGAVYLKETATGRVGILSNILPEPPAPESAVRVCGYDDKGSAAGANRYTRRDSNCALGTGNAMMRALGPADTYTGNRPAVADGGRVVRPATGNLTVLFDVWGDGSGHFNHADDGATGLQARLGHLGAGAPAFVFNLDARYTASGPGNPISVDGPTADGTAASETAAGLAFFADETGVGGGSVGTLTISPNSNYCDANAKPPKSYPVSVTVIAWGDTTTGPTYRDQVTPRINEDSRDSGEFDFEFTRHTVNIVCPSGSSSSNQGVELVPENPFPEG